VIVLHRLVSSLLVGMALVVLHTSAWAQPRGVEVNTEWVLEADGVEPGGLLRGAFKMDLPKGYHTNSNTPLEDYLIPSVLTMELPEGIALKELVYPEALEIIAGGSTTPLAVYEEKFAIGVVLEVAGTMAPGDYPVKTKFRYQACDDKSCYAPKNIRKEITISIVAPGTPITTNSDPVFAAIAWDTGTDASQTSPAETTSTETTTEAPTTAQASTEEIMALLEQFDVVAMDGGFLKPAKFIEFIDAAESGTVRKGLFEDRGPIAILFLIIIGGMVLNLTPCVLPMIPINLAIIGAGAQAGSKSRGFVLGAAYGSAMALVYGILGLVVILTAGSFGTINSTLWFNAGIAVLFVVLGLAMFDVIAIDFSKFQSKIDMAGKGKKGSVPLAFGMGGIAALLAGACVAPVVIQVIIFGSDQYAKGVTLALALPFFLGLGMALPWPFAGAGMSFLPKPGAWMVRVKQAMGVFILAFAGYYGYQAYEILDQHNVDQAKVAESVEALLEEGWTPNMAQGLEQALAEDKLVLVDMWATWCKNCLVMDQTTLKNEEVNARLEDYVKIKFQAEEPDESPAADVMAHFGGIGLPTYAILRPKPNASQNQ
jgi:thioredoxin:protein disulfide reductase